ncbi:MAG: hypothetical protein EON59_14790 [Alphaproteobacteria bacterium]|nr:MAG: hypothetical protein EON59_14790 [Alphaproteobacteria bacterium]
MTITVQKLPKDFKTDPVISLTFNAKGEVATCATAKTSGSAGIDRVACNQVKGNVKEPVEAGAAPAARDVTVTFVQEPPKG